MKKNRWKKLTRWYRRRQFNKAYIILRKEADRHKKAEHMMEFHATNESYVLMRCYQCPNLQP